MLPQAFRYPAYRRAVPSHLCVAAASIPDNGWTEYRGGDVKEVDDSLMIRSYPGRLMQILGPLFSPVRD
jgi:hypothetical protein